MTTRRRTRLIGIGGFFGGAFVHGLLPPWDIPLRAAATGFACLVFAGLLTVLLPRPSQP